MQVQYLDHMGTDLSVARDARISFDKSSDAVEYVDVNVPSSAVIVSIPTLTNADKRLIEFLARGCRSGQWNELVDEALVGTNSTEEAEALLRYVKKMPTHWTPFAHQVIKLRMKAPVPIRTQCFKHKIGFVENEESRRYISSTPELFIPKFRLAPEVDIKQGSAGPHPDNELLTEVYRSQCEASIRIYEQFIQEGVSPEQARFVLPQGVCVNWVWTGSLYAFAEWYNKRSDRSHSQGEVADLADEASKIIEALFPVSWRALTQI